MILQLSHRKLYSHAGAHGAILFAAALLLTTAGVARASTPLQVADLDPAAFTTSLDGASSPAGTPDAGPASVVWTQTTQFQGAGAQDGLSYGDGKSLDVRYLRIGFTRPVAVGSVLVRGGGELSVLRISAAYPGDVTKDDEWVTAQRIVGGVIGSEEASREEYALWVLPPGTTTRALRFSHTPEASDASYAGWLGGVYLYPDRFANLAPAAMAKARANDEHAYKINDSTNNQMWNVWDNQAPQPPAALVSEDAPEWVSLNWPVPVKLTGLALLWAGFGAGDVQTYTGPVDRNPLQATEADWRTISPLTGLVNGYPYPFWPNFVDFGQTVTTRALRIRMTAPTKESHPHLLGQTKGGRRVWLGEVVAFSPLGAEPLESAVPAPVQTQAHAPIPVTFTLTSPGYVTLVIEDAAGKRVRNLISAVQFPAGKDTVWWDGTDDLGRDVDASNHGSYHIPAQFVAPGSYRVRGLVRPQIDLRYEFSANSSGAPPWSTADGTGGWLTTHTPAQAALYVPGAASPTGKDLVYLGCYLAEGGSGLIWVDEDGHKQGGRMWVGGVWTAAPFLARDGGPKAVPGDCAYVASPWKEKSDLTGATAGIRLTALTTTADRPLPAVHFDLDTTIPAPPGDMEFMNAYMGGLAAHNGLLVVSQPVLNTLLVIDASSGAVVAKVTVDHPQGVAFESSGALLVVSGTKLLRFTGDLRTATTMTGAGTVVSSGLDDPHGLTTDQTGRIYVSNWGTSHQVKIFSTSGQLLGDIGHPGAPSAGTYDPLHMNFPAGMTVDGNNHLWVTEETVKPKRVSVWDQEGTLLKTFYGPALYGGGGALDPQDKSQFYYDGMAFKADWTTGQSAPSRIFWIKQPKAQAFPGGAPQQAMYANGQQYMTNCYSANPTSGTPIAVVFRRQDEAVVPAAAMGRAESWPLLGQPEFQSRWPAGLDSKNPRTYHALFVWSDLNGDGIVQPNEVTMKAETTGGVTVMPDLTLVESRVNGNVEAFSPTKFTAEGTPVYDLDAVKIISSQAQDPFNDGGDQVLVSPDGWTVMTVPPKPYSSQGIGGLKDGVPVWSYPSLWPALHSSHSAPVPTFSGELIGTTRLLGGFVTPRSGEGGPLWAINGNLGDIYLFTEDGLFVSQLFQDMRQGKPWSMPVAQRGMLLNDISLHDENFFPTINQTADGNIYVVDGARNTVVSVNGLEQIQRIAPQTLTVTPADLTAAHQYFVQEEAERQKLLGTGLLTVPVVDDLPALDDGFASWPSKDWAVIDHSGTYANFNSDSKPYDISASVVVSGDQLCAAWRTGDPKLLQNSGNEPSAPFKTGGALDLQIEAAPGGERLLVTRKAGATWAVLYRAKVPGTVTPVLFSSPDRSIAIDSVEDVSASVKLVARGGNYAVVVPLALLGLMPTPGTSLRADIGVLRGDGAQTLQRSYWNNKATAITADVPSEAELTPALWGTWTFAK